jgi:ribonuclease P protein component
MEQVGGTAGRDQRLPRAARITGSDEIRKMFRRGKRRRTRHLDVFVSISPVAHSRIGLVVPKPRAEPGKRGRKRAAAVRRNRLKRRLREVARTMLLPELNARGCHRDVLVRVRPEAYGVRYRELRDELTQLEEWLCSSVA